MANIDDVADYIIESMLADGDFEELSNLKLQKLFFYAQAWSIPILQRSLIDDFADFEAWNHGPINVHIYNRFKATKGLYSLMSIKDVRMRGTILSHDTKLYIDYILSNYAKLSSLQLEILCLGEEPWIRTRKKIISNPTNKIITRELINQYYGEKWKLLKC